MHSSSASAEQSSQCSGKRDSDDKAPSVADGRLLSKEEQKRAFEEEEAERRRLQRERRMQRRSADATEVQQTSSSAQPTPPSIGSEVQTTQGCGIDGSQVSTADSKSSKLPAKRALEEDETEKRRLQRERRMQRRIVAIDD